MVLYFKGYKFVIICSSENEYKLLMILVFDKFWLFKIVVVGVIKM